MTKPNFDKKIDQVTLKYSPTILDKIVYLKYHWVTHNIIIHFKMHPKFQSFFQRDFVKTSFIRRDLRFKKIPSNKVSYSKNCKFLA